MEIGERWAYRQNRGMPLEEVVVIAIREKYPPRARVEYQADERGGDAEWVPAGRLKALWADRVQFQCEEAKWANVEADGRPDSAERDAAQQVFWSTLRPEIADLYYNGAMGIGVVGDVEALSSKLGWPASRLTESAGAFMEEGKLHLRWGLTKAVARRLAELHPDRVLRYVDARELDHREHLADLARQYEVAYYYKRPAEISAMLEKFRNPIDVAELDCLRDWCGAAAVSSDMKLRKLEEDFIALALLARQAATEVRRLGTKKANQLAHEIESAASRNGTPAP